MRAECIRAIEELALSDPKVVVVASDPGANFMPELASRHSERLMIEGICEQALVGVSAGLASEGYYPFMVSLAVFVTRRCYEQLLVDFGVHQFAGCVVGTGGGLHYASLGPTHIAVDDFSLIGAIPGSAVLAPGEPKEAAFLAQQARTFPGLSYIRLAGTVDPLPNLSDDIVLGKGRFLDEAKESVLFISCGAATLAVQAAIDNLKTAGIQAAVIHLHTVKPLDTDLIRRRARQAQVVLCVEEHRQVGGLSSAVLHALTSVEPPVAPARFASIGIDDAFPMGYGSYEEQMEHYGMTGPALADRARALLSRVSGVPADDIALAMEESA